MECSQCHTFQPFIVMHRWNYKNKDKSHCLTTGEVRTENGTLFRENGFEHQILRNPSGNVFCSGPREGDGKKKTLSGKGTHTQWSVKEKEKKWAFWMRTQRRIKNNESDALAMFFFIFFSFLFFFFVQYLIYTYNRISSNCDDFMTSID